MKCVTAAATQKLLPADAPFTTAVEICGEVSNRVLKGNLYVIGGGDPTLVLVILRIVTALFLLSAVGCAVKESIPLQGDIVIDSSVYPSIGVSPYWLLEDTPWEYGAGLYGINYHDNSFSMTVYPGEDVIDVPYDIEVENLLKQGKTG